MRPAEYLEAIHMATTAAELGELLALSKGDPELSRASESRIQSAVNARFQAIKGESNLASHSAPRPAGRPGKVCHPKKGASK